MRDCGTIVLEKCLAVISTTAKTGDSSTLSRCLFGGCWCEWFDPAPALHATKGNASKADDKCRWCGHSRRSHEVGCAQANVHQRVYFGHVLFVSISSSLLEPFCPSLMLNRYNRMSPLNDGVPVQSLPACTPRIDCDVWPPFNQPM
jgi:hypothetical protein